MTTMLDREPALYAYQAEVLGPMEQGDPIYLGFDPGLGKSRTALEAAKLRKVRRLLIVCPASGRYVWQAEIRKWWPTMPLSVIASTSDLVKLRQDRGAVLITYGLLSQKDSVYAAAIASGPVFGMTILDEAAALKNSGANRTKAVFGKMLPKLGYVVPMSGTPAPNHAGELYTVLKAVYPEALVRNGRGSATVNEWEFQDMFCKVVMKRFGLGGRDVRVIEGSKNLEDLKRRMYGFMRRVRKEDVLTDLPAIRWDVVPVKTTFTGDLPVTPNLSDEELLKYLSGASGDEHVMRLRRLLGMAKLDASVEYIQDFLDNLPPERKVLVFAHHKDVISRLATDLGASKPAILTGSSSAYERARAIDMFMADPACRVFIGNIAAAGTGITLVGPTCKCSDVIFVEATYSVGDNVQAACRVHRIGQHDAVVARFLTATGTLDDRIQAILARKAQDFATLFN